MEPSHVQQAAKCLKEFETSIIPSAFYDKWEVQKNYFRATVDLVIDKEDIDILFLKLRSLENHVKYSRQTFSWRNWKRKNWRFLTDPSLNVPDKITLFIVVLKFMEQNLILEAHGDNWMDFQREEWLHKCDALLTEPALQEPRFSCNLLSNVQETLQHCGYGKVPKNDALLNTNLYLQMGKPEVQQAVQCLKALENNIKISAFDKEWKIIREDFITTIDKVEEMSDTEILFRQLKSLESHIDYKKDRDCTRIWELKYWKFLTDFDGEIMFTITRLMITLQFMEDNILLDVFTDEWRKSKRDEWLKMTDNLVDPCLQLLVYNELLMKLDNLLALFHYNTLQSFEKDVEDVASHIHMVANELDKINKGTGIADATGGALITASATLGLIGLILAPFTAGVSTALTLAGLGVGASGVSTSLISSIVHIAKDKEKTKEVQQKTENLTGVMMNIGTILEHFVKSFQELKAKLSSLGESGAMTYITDIGAVTSCIAGGGRNLAAIVTIARQVATQGLRTSVALEAAVPSVFKEVSSLASVAAVVSGLLNLFGVGIGIFSIVMGVKKTKNGSRTAKQLRKLADNLPSVMSETLEAYHAVKIYYEEHSEDINLNNIADQEGRYEPDNDGNSGSGDWNDAKDK